MQRAAKQLVVGAAKTAEEEERRETESIFGDGNAAAEAGIRIQRTILFLFRTHVPSPFVEIIPLITVLR